MTTVPVAGVPLHVQVRALRTAHPDVLLLVECGYKYRLFGPDAELAASLLGIFASRNKAFSDGSSTASVPVHRLGVHVRRLVAHGVVVGVVKVRALVVPLPVARVRSCVCSRCIVNCMLVWSSTVCPVCANDDHVDSDELE